MLEDGAESLKEQRLITVAISLQVNFQSNIAIDVVVTTDKGQNKQTLKPDIVQQP